MDLLERIDIERTCARLSTAFAVRVDHGDCKGVAELFAPDGRFARADMALEGPEEIRAFLERRPATRVTRHVCTNVLITVEDASRATGLTYFMLFDGDRDAAGKGGQSAAPLDMEPLEMELPRTVGEYHDIFLKTPDGWRIAQRRSVAVFRR